MKIVIMEIPGLEYGDEDQVHECHDRDTLMCFDTFLDYDVYKGLESYSRSVERSKSEALNDIVRAYLNLMDVPSRVFPRNAFSSQFWDDWEIGKHKNLSIRYGRYDIRRNHKYTFHRNRHDHAGFEMELTLFGRTIQVEFHDSRHWNDKENRFYRAGEEEKEYSKSRED
ncbi:MAG TPA: hypothetical protein VNJ01_15585 [Bacteriovoracaceae bacterium]|nr:hypothetical protein [Bacteriovoracaceae bacterium]